MACPEMNARPARVTQERKLVRTAFDHRRLALIPMEDAMESTTSGPRSSIVQVDGIDYLRTVVTTRWLTPRDDLAEAIRQGVEGIARRGDTIVVTEKVAILLTGRSIPIADYQPGRVARVLAQQVRPRPGSRGLSVPEKMEYVLRHSGKVRLLLAVAASAITRPLGLHGIFYRIAGGLARDIDGARPPFDDVLLPPLDGEVARALCARLETSLGTGVAIVDINDFGGRVRATSEHSLPAGLLHRVFADNPLGQRDQRTPIGVVRAAAGRGTMRPPPAATPGAMPTRESRST